MLLLAGRSVHVHGHNSHTLVTSETSSALLLMELPLSFVQYGRQREFLVRERTAKDGFYALSIRYHYR